MIDLNLNHNIEDYEKFSNNLKEDYYLKLFIGEKTIHNILNSLDKAEFITNSAAKHLPEVPRTLTEATELFSNSAFAKEAFGREVVEHYTNFFQTEQQAFEKSVTDWERKRYFERI